jgi:hypothetical protein
MSPTDPPPEPAADDEDDAPDLLIWGALATICCCPPYGIAAIAASHRARALRAEGDLAGSAEAHARAARHLRLSVVYGVIANLLGLLLIGGALYFLYVHWDDLVRGDPLSSSRAPLGQALGGLALVLHRPLTRLRRPLVVGLAIAGIGSLALVDPATSPLVPRCLFRDLTNLHCPGCGTLRGLHLALRGDLAAAWRWNPAVFALATASPWLLLPISHRARRRIGLLVLALLVGFGIARNAIP